MTSTTKRPGIAFWATVLLVVVVLYVLSSGPTRMLGVHMRTSVMDRPVAMEWPDGSVTSMLSTKSSETSAWWSTAYWPLLKVSEHPRASAILWWYWSLFPIRDA